MPEWVGCADPSVSSACKWDRLDRLGGGEKARYKAASAVRLLYTMVIWSGYGVMWALQCGVWLA